MFTYTTIYFDETPVPGRALDIWIPPGKQLRPLTLFFVHGGGWRQGKRDQMHAIMLGFFKSGYVCVSVDYRLSKTYVPRQVDDVREGMTLADAFLRGQGISNPFVLYGSSAGGHLALLAGLASPIAYGGSFEGELPSVAGIVTSCSPVTFEPWEDIFPGSWNSMQEAVGVTFAQAPEEYRRLSPDQYVSSESNLFFILGECEHMFPNALTIDLVERLRALGGGADYRIYPSAEHGFFYDFSRNNQQMALQDMLGFLGRLSAQGTKEEVA